MTALRVVLDGPVVGRTPAGPGVHLQQLVRAILDGDPEIELVLRRVTARRAAEAWAEAHRLHPRMRRRIVPVPGATLRRLQRRPGGPSERWVSGRFDVYHQLHADADPLVPSESLVVTLHDTVALHWPEAEGQMFDGAPTLLRRAAAVITVSEYSRQAILKAFEVDPDRVHVIPNGVDHQRMNPTAVAGQLPGELSGRPYLLFVGGGTPRKNVEGLVKAFGLLQDGFPDVCLALAGPVCAQAEALRAMLPPAARPQLLPLGYVSEAELATLYARSVAVVLPSLYEGFGLPALEALACGTRVVASSAGALPEVCGGCEVGVDPHSVASIAEGVRQVLTETAESRDRAVRAGLRHAAGFTWEEAARRTAGVYAEAAAP